jgi:transposase
MSPKTSSAKKPAGQVVKDIRRATRRHISAEDQIRIVLVGLRGEDSIAELCRKEGIVERIFAWISRNRRLTREFERYASTAFVMVRLTLKRLNKQTSAGVESDGLQLTTAGVASRRKSRSASSYILPASKSLCA